MPILSSYRNVVLAKIVLATVLISHASQARCQVTYVAPEVIYAPPAQYPAVYADPSQPFTSSPIYYDIQNTPRPQFSAPLDTVIVDEDGTMYPQIANGLCPSALVTSGLFFQVDYFSRFEPADSGGNIKETGPLFSLGYHAYKPKYKYRVALFGGNLNYDDPDLAADDIEVSTSPHSEYFGVSFEYDFRWSLPSRPNASFFVGFGTRWWQRTTSVSAYITESAIVDMSLKDNWFTFYPRIGLDSFRQLGNGWQLYTSVSLGLTAYTSQHVDRFEANANITNNLGLTFSEELDWNFRPKSDIYAKAEVSLRKNHLFMSLMVERFGWQKSDYDKGHVQDESSILTAGFLAGCHF